MQDRKSTRLNSSHTVIYTLSLHDALPIYLHHVAHHEVRALDGLHLLGVGGGRGGVHRLHQGDARSEEHTSELQSHSDLHSFPTRRSSDLPAPRRPPRGPSA